VPSQTLARRLSGLFRIEREEFSLTFLKMSWLKRPFWF
jgi:hypothetical protein